MATGVEIAGLVLAALPIVVEAVKLYVSGARTIKDVLLPQHRDEKLEDFYEDLWIEMHLFSQQLRVILDALPGLSDQRKSELEKGLTSIDSTVGSTAARSLKAYFSSEDDYNVFEQLIDRIARLLCRLIEDRYHNIRSSELSSDQLLKKLQAFTKRRDSKTSSSSLKERLNLRMREKDLQRGVAKLEKWNNRLRVLIAHNERLQNNSGNIMQKSKEARQRPSVAISRMPQVLYDALLQYYGCRCGEHHSAMFGLHLPHSIHRAIEPVQLEFDVFLSLPKTLTPPRWQESRIHVRQQEMTKVSFSTLSQAEKFSERQKLLEVCQEAEVVYNKGHCLCLLAENDGGQYKMWRLRSMKRQLPFLNTLETASLAMCMTSFMKLSLSEKRALALLLAYGLVLLDGSPWLNDRWTKSHISFFKNDSSDNATFDFTRPYIVSSIERSTGNKTSTSLDTLHPNLSILSLGILLIEIETGYPIEHFRHPEDLPNGVEDENTDFLVADRVARSLSNCTPDYQEAIFACLDVPWRAAGKRIALEDPDTRNAVYDTIISRLEAELDSLDTGLVAT